MQYVGRNANGTDGSNLSLMSDNYLSQGQIVSIPANTSAANRLSAILTALQALPTPSVAALGKVDCTQTGAVPVDVIGLPGYGFRPLGYSFFVIAASGVTLAPTITIGTNSPNYDNISKLKLGGTGIHNLTGYVAADGETCVLDLIKWKAITTPTPVYINVVTAAVATAYVIGADFDGKLIPVNS